MDKKIFLEKFGSKTSNNTTEGLNISLKGNRRLLPTGEYSGVISAYDQYTKERENCNTIRLTCQVNTISSNVLFNSITEVVKDEGSSAVTFLNYGILNGDIVTDSTTPIVDDDSIIYYKPETMNFWSSCSMNYASTVRSVSTSSPEEDLTDIDKTIQITDIDKDSTTNATKKHITNAIRDTQLSNDNFVYHCGVDFFNNHLLRSNTFKTVCKFPSNTEITDTYYTAFNTIADLMRDANGDIVAEKIGYPSNSGINGNVKSVALHLYNADEIDSYKDTVSKKLIKKYNGWLGFYNHSKIKSYDNFSDSRILPIDKPIMYVNGGDFVDMYPGHELYSFVPLYNKYRQRFEKNWNYCVTYPFSSYTPTYSDEPFSDIIEPSNGSLKAVYFDENTRADNGTAQLVIYSIAKHGLVPGDYVNIYVTNDSGTTKIIDNAEVTQVADDFIFTVFTSGVKISNEWVQINTKEDDDLNTDGVQLIISGETTADTKVYTQDQNKVTIYYDEEYHKYFAINGKYVTDENGTRFVAYINLDKDAQNISYKKVVNDIECEYYVRLFSRVPNFRFASAGTKTEYDITKKDDNGETMIDKYNTYEYEFENHVSRLAFSKNIYSDDIGEIVFTDDINISNLRDNRGRPLTSLYLTIIKNNSGYKEWYSYDYDNWSPTAITDSNVEFSHCFGKISCGIDTSDESLDVVDVNSIKKISTIGNAYGYDVDAINGERDYGNENIHITPTEISYKHDKLFYGDLCYYDYYNATEVSIQPILHRFNTAQRECDGTDINACSNFTSFIYDEIKSDDFDATGDFSINSKYISDCNKKKEGYYYIPHYEIPIKSFGKIQYTLPDILDIRSITSYPNEDKKLYPEMQNVKRIHTLQRHFLTPGDKALIYDTETDNYYYLTAINSTGSTDNVFYCVVSDEKGVEASNSIYDMSTSNGDDTTRYSLFKLDNMNVPDYATLLKDGTCRYIWRDVVNNGIDGGDRNLEEYPFTNGAFYVNKRIDLYVRRQDPYGINGLYSDDDIIGEEILIENEDNYIKDEDITC